MPRVAAAVLYTCILITSAAAQEFTGSWRFTDERPESGSLPDAPAATLEIVDQNKTIRCTLTRPGSPPLSFSFTTDGKETKVKDGDTNLSIAAKWEGSALLVNTIVNRAASSYTQMDRWRVVRGGTRLLIRREIVRHRANAESTLVYDRQHTPGAEARK